MSKKIETKKEGKEFDRFNDLFKKVIKVPKSEIDRREKELKKQRDDDKKKKA